MEKCWYYILDEDKEPVPEPDLTKWAEWFESSNRVVRRNTTSVTMKRGDQEKNVGEITISTVFLGLDHSFTGNPPLLFETMVFGGPLDQQQERCSTWEGAEMMHEKMMERVKLAVKELNDD